MTKIIGLFAMTPDGVIGQDNKLPWNVPKDLKHFKNLTYNNTVIMGRRTFESIGSMPLIDRQNIVISSTPCGSTNMNLWYADNLPKAGKIAKSLCKPKIFIIGGASVLNQCFEHNYLDEIIQTEIPLIIGGSNLTKIDLDLYNKSFKTIKTELLETNQKYGKIKIHYKEKI